MTSPNHSSDIVRAGDTGTKYPKRSSHFAHKVTRLLFKSCAAQDIGRDAVLLIVNIAHTEDAARYCGPVRFWNSQLVETMGFSGANQLNDARRRAIDAGWLHYERATNRAVGNYWVTIPEQFHDLSDSPLEPPFVQDMNDSRNESGSNQRRKLNGKRVDSPANSGASSTPVPNTHSLSPPPETSEDWGEVEAALIRCKVGKILDAVRTAQRNQVSPQDVIAIVEYAESKPGAYGPGAIFKRIENHRPGLPIHAGWPVEDDRFIRQREVEAKHERKANENLIREEQERQRAADRLKAEAAEREYGPVLDNMTVTEQSKFAEANLDEFQLQRFRRDPTGPIVREMLLSALRNDN